MYNRLFGDEGETKTDKFKGLLIAFILGNVIIWMVPEVVAQMDPCLRESSSVGYLPRTIFTDDSNPSSGGTPGSPGTSGTVDHTVPHGHPPGMTHLQNSPLAGGTQHRHFTDQDGDNAFDIGEPEDTHPNHGTGHVHDFPIELYDFFPSAYASHGNADEDGCLDTTSFASTSFHSIVQTILFVVKIVMVLGVVGAVGIMRFR